MTYKYQGRDISEGSAEDDAIKANAASLLIMVFGLIMLCQMMFGVMAACVYTALRYWWVAIAGFMLYMVL